jgi:hypothetical protein
MQEGETRHTVKKGRDSRTLIKTLLVRAPRLQRAARHVQSLSGLTLGEALGLQIAIPRTQLSAFNTIPAVVAIIVALLRLLDYCAHSDLLFTPLPLSS